LTLDQLNKKIRIAGIVNGLILGVVYTILSIFCFYIKVRSTTSPVSFIGIPIILRVFIPIFIVLLLSFLIRKNVGGYWTFKQATTGIFIMLLVAYVIHFIGNDLVFNKLIEPNNAQITEKISEDFKSFTMKGSGAKKSDIDASINSMRKTFSQDKGNSIKTDIITNAGIILFLFVFALLFSALLRNAEYVPASQAER
jgi:hypothetical protein